MQELYQIYLITDLTNNKRYVGQTVKHRGYLVRFNEHLNGSKHANTRLLSNAIIKHSKDNFIVNLIEDNIEESDIDEKEIYYIKYFNTFYTSGHGYNMTGGEQGIHGYRHNEKTKIIIGDKSKKFWTNLYLNPDKLQERNKKISLKLSGIRKSELTRLKLSQAAKNRFKNNPGTFKGKKHSELSKKKVALKNGHAVVMIDKETKKVLKSFISATEASKYLIDNNLTTNKSAFTRIITICNKIKGQGKTAYGYIWEYLK